MKTMINKTKHLTFFLASLEGGGIQRAAMRLIRELVRKGILITLVVINGTGPARKEIPEGCELVDLNCNRTRYAFFDLLKYLLREKPSIGISSQTHLNVLMILLSSISGYPKHLVVREHNTFIPENIKTGKLFERSRIWLIKYFYPFASKFVAVSKSVARSIHEHARYKKEIQVIRNGIDVNEIRNLINNAPEYPWRKNIGDKKLIVGMGRLSQQKNFSDLLLAFSHIKDQTTIHLLIMGEGVESENLRGLSQNLQIEEKVDFPGFIANPYPVLAEADVFVLSSRWEGFGNVILEALACGVPVVATDCPGGPADILEGKSFARIVPLGDPKAMANSITDLLVKEIDQTQIINYAQKFNIEIVAQKYIDMINEFSQSTL